MQHKQEYYGKRDRRKERKEIMEETVSSRNSPATRV
jgi:hypothetical protein